MDTGMKKLLEAARKAKEKAYAPYSHFHVGAAVLTETGKLYSGCNVENTSYGLTVCAERNAIFQMVADGEQRIAEILVLGDTEEFLPPCGACRQILREFAGPDGNLRVIVVNLDGDIRTFTIAELLPEGFTPDQLG